MKKILISAVAIALIVPQVAMAAWWNPISWFRKQPAKTAIQGSSVKTATSTATEIENLQKRIEDLKKHEATTVAGVKTPVVSKKKVEKVAPIVDNSEIIRAQADIIKKAKEEELSRIDIANTQLAKQIADTERKNYEDQKATQIKQNCISTHYSNAKIQEATDNAIATLKSSLRSSKSSVTSQYDNEIIFVKDKEQRDLSVMAESERGYGRVLGAYSEITSKAENDIKELERRKQELLLMADANIESKISVVIAKSLELKIESTESVCGI